MGSISTDFNIIINHAVCHNIRNTNMMSSGVTRNYLARMCNGSALFIGKNFNISFKPGDYLFIPYGCKYHSHWSGELIEWDSIEFTHFPETADYPIQKLELSEAQRERFDRLCECKTSDCSTIALIYTILANQLPYMTKREYESDTIELATEFMLKNPTASISDVAKYCHMSESGLFAVFRRSGCTPVTLRRAVQVRNAVMLLRTTDLPINTISSMCGFNSVSYFNRVIREMYGCTPTQCRTQALF